MGRSVSPPDQSRGISVKGILFTSGMAVFSGTMERLVALLTKTVGRKKNLCAFASSLGVARGTNGNASSFLEAFSRFVSLVLNVGLLSTNVSNLSSIRDAAILCVPSDGVDAVWLAALTRAVPASSDPAWPVGAIVLFRGTALVLISLVAARLHPEHARPRDP